MYDSGYFHTNVGHSLKKKNEETRNSKPRRPVPGGIRTEYLLNASQIITTVLIRSAVVWQQQ
jgi:hypothetical protein